MTSPSLSLLFLVGLVYCATAVTSVIAGASDLCCGPLEDLKCDVETVTDANTKHLHSILQELMNSTYFRLFPVDLDKECPFLSSSEVPPCTSVEDDGSETCSLSGKLLL